MTAFFCAYGAENIFSPVNKYQLATPLLDSMRARSLDTGFVPFFGLPNDFASLPRTPALMATVGKQKVGGNIFVMPVIDGRSSQSMYNYYLGCDIAYESPHVMGAITYDVHSTKQCVPQSIADTLSDIKTEQVNTGYNHIDGTNAKDFNFPAGYLKLAYNPLSLLVGKYKLRWGPGYKGNLGLSGTTFAPFYFYYLQLSMGSLLTASCFLNGLDDDFLFSSAGIPRYSAGQRLDIRLGKHWQIGIYELVDFSGVNLLARYANPLQIYYFANVSGGNSVSDPGGERASNVLGGGDISFNCNRLRVYGAVLNDDLTMFDANGSPNKFGAQGGVVYYLDGHVREIGAEYTHVSWGTYTHRNPGFGRHTYFGESRGFPYGNDIDLWNIRARGTIVPTLDWKTELNVWVKGDGTLELYHWDLYDLNGTPAPGHGDNQGGGVDYVHDQKMVQLNLSVTYNPYAWLSIGGTYEPSFTKTETVHYAQVFARASIPHIKSYSTQ